MLTMQQAREMRQGTTLSGDRNQCSDCSLLFNSSAAFDKHRTSRIGVYEGEQARRCMTRSEMELSGMALNQAGFWVNHRQPAAYVAELIREQAAVGVLEACGNPAQVVGQP
ncbi:hypothetical protein IAG25_15780 [Caballeronia sp. EK]|uniref:hypothetical protein n=1 Tax=Caballeronia sp. EK TaxID=2767469 RepID=UPI0016567687|nr:hypothetical protein [Caballeronia sp. EK]MBC8638280.1 hypothetical protein [Caballeronia sp. EK]